MSTQCQCSSCDSFKEPNLFSKLRQKWRFLYFRIGRLKFEMTIKERHDSYYNRSYLDGRQESGMYKHLFWRFFWDYPMKEEGDSK